MDGRQVQGRCSSWLLVTALLLLLAVLSGRALALRVPRRCLVRTRQTVLHFNKPSSSNRNEFDPESDDSRGGDDDADDDFDLDRAISAKMDKRNRGSSTSAAGGRRPAAVVKNLNRWEVINRALLAGAFVAGIGSGITIDSAINTNPRDLASRYVSPSDDVSCGRAPSPPPLLLPPRPLPFQRRHRPQRAQPQDLPEVRLGRHGPGPARLRHLQPVQRVRDAGGHQARLRAARVQRRAAAAGAPPPSPHGRLPSL